MHVRDGPAGQLLAGAHQVAQRCTGSRGRRGEVHPLVPGGCRYGRQLPGRYWQRTGGLAGYQRGPHRGGERRALANAGVVELEQVQALLVGLLDQLGGQRRPRGGVAAIGQRGHQPAAGQRPVGGQLLACVLQVQQDLDAELGGQQQGLGDRVYCAAGVGGVGGHPDERQLGQGPLAQPAPEHVGDGLVGPVGVEAGFGGGVREQAR